MNAPAVLVTADLSVSVSTPHGRSASIRVDDADGTVRIDIDNGAVLLAALPRGARGPGNWRLLRRLVLTLREAGVRWEQPVDLIVGGRVLLRRRNGIWRPSAGVALPGVAAGLGVVLLLLGLGALIARLLRGSRSAG